MQRAFLPISFLVLATVLPVQAQTRVWPTDYDPRYVASVDKTQGELTQTDVSHKLTTIGASDHIRNSSGQILMTMFTGYENPTGTVYYNRTYSSASHPNLWLTVAPELQDFITTNNVSSHDVTDRVCQRLGLPLNSEMPQSGKSYYIVESWASNSSLFRPAMNADITNPNTSLKFVGVMADPTSTERLWFDANYNKTYDPNKSHPPYPWTRAGYTYDWGNDTNHVGQTEFIIKTGGDNTMTVRDVITITSYGYYNRTTDSFNVTDWCDTIWVGSNYLPVNPSGNVVNIASGVTISGGEGITITDLTTEYSNFVINNHGTIQGVSRTFGGVERKSSVFFTNTGGTLNNWGVITGDQIGVYGTNSTRSIVIDNKESGTIRGSEYAIKTSNGNDVITNAGLIDGHIDTGGGDDTVNIAGGSVTGSIQGGDGVNTLNFNLAAGAAFGFSQEIDGFTNVNVNSGTVRLNGNVDGNVNVMQGATLGGNARLLSNLINYGTVGPGNSIGTMTVGGNYTQQPGGTLAIEVTKTAAGVSSDMLHVTGNGVLETGSAIQILCDQTADRVFTTGDTFEFMTTGGALTDHGAAVVLDSPFITAIGTPFAFVAGGASYSLELYRTATFASVANTPNNASMGAALDADSGMATNGYAGIINHLLFSNADGFNASLHQFSPSAYLAVSAATNRTTQYMTESMGQYLRGRRSGHMPTMVTPASGYKDDIAFTNVIGGPGKLADVTKYCDGAQSIIRELQNSDTTRSAWVTPFGLFYGERTSGDHLGFQSNVAGAQFGIDKQFSDTFIFGIGGGYDNMHTSTNDWYSAGTTDTLRVGPYATWYNDEWFVDSSLTGGFHDNDLGRTVSVGGDTYTAKGATTPGISRSTWAADETFRWAVVRLPRSLRCNTSSTGRTVLRKQAPTARIWPSIQRACTRCGRGLAESLPGWCGEIASRSCRNYSEVGPTNSWRTTLLKAASSAGCRRFRPIAAASSATQATMGSASPSCPTSDCRYTPSATASIRRAAISRPSTPG